MFLGIQNTSLYDTIHLAGTLLRMQNFPEN